MRKRAKENHTLNHLFEFLPFQITVIVSVIMRKHDADQILLAVIILGH